MFNAERAAAFTEDTALRNLRKEYDTYRARNPPAKQAEIDELKILVESIRTSIFADSDDGIIPLIQAQDAEIKNLKTQIAKVPVLQSASEVKDAEIARLTAQIETLQKNDTALTDQGKLNQQHEAEMKAVLKYMKDLQQVIVSARQPS